MLPRWLKNKWIDLTYSPHALQRLEERCKGCLMLKPNKVKITNENVIYWHKNEEKHVKLKIKINYSRQQDLILVVQLDGLVRTLYYQKKNYGNNSKFRQLSKI